MNATIILTADEKYFATELNARQQSFLSNVKANPNAWCCSPEEVIRCTVAANKIAAYCEFNEVKFVEFKKLSVIEQMRKISHLGIHHLYINDTEMGRSIAEEVRNLILLQGK